MRRDFDGKCAGHNACSLMRTHVDDGHALPVLRAAMRNASFERERRGRRARQREVSREPRRPVREGMDGRRHARTRRPAARAAGTRRQRPTRSGELGRGAQSRRGRLQQDSDPIRERCGRGVRQRRADQREGVSRRQVRPRRPGHGQHRLQRTVLHVVGGRRRRARVRDRSRPALSARRHPQSGGDPARRRKSRRNDASADAVLRGAAAQRRLPDRRRSPADADRVVGAAAPAAAARNRCGAGQRPAAHLDSRSDDRRVVHRRPDRGLRRGAADRGVVLARAGRTDHRRARGDARRRGPSAGHGGDGDGVDVPRTRTAGPGRDEHARLRQRRAGARHVRAGRRRLRHAHRPGQRPGRPRARPEIRSASRLPMD